MATQEWPNDSIFEPFKVQEFTYKNVDGLEVKTALLVPKRLDPGHHPVIINLHGGFLINAHSLFAPFFSPWVVRLALDTGAIVISPDYRLLPTENGVTDILQDLDDFWTWTKTELVKTMEISFPGHVPDMQRIVLAGGSAGGYCAVQLAISHPDEVRLLAMAYPELDVKDQLFVTGPEAGEPNVLRAPDADIPSKEAVLEWISKSKQSVVTKAGFERTPFAIGTAQHGLYYTHVFESAGEDQTRFIPFERIKTGGKLPRNIWIMHGDDDSIVHIRGTRKFMDLVQQKLPDVVVRLDVAHGQDHAFDHLNFATWESFIDDGGINFMKRAWIGATDDTKPTSR